MAITLNPNNISKVVDKSTHLTVIPNKWSLTEDLGLFEDKYVSQKTVRIDRDTLSDRIATHRNWDERNNTIGKDKRDFLILEIPHTPIDDAIYPSDLDGVINVNSAEELLQLETVNSVRADKMGRLRRAHALTLEASRMHLITTGEVLDPRGVTRQSYGALNYYTEFGLTQQSFNVNLAVANDPRANIETPYQAVQDAAGNGSIYANQIALCSSEFFQKLASNGFVVESMRTVATVNSSALDFVLGRNAGGRGLDTRYRTIEFGGVTFIDAGRASYELPDGTVKRYIEADEAFLMPYKMEDLFHTYYAPPNKFGYINKKSQGSYWFEYLNDKQDIIEIMTEQNFLNAMLYPQCVVKLVATTS